MSSILKASHKRKAATLGKNRALDDIFLGATEPREGLLSGEWADEPTPYDLCTQVGFPHWADVDQELIDADEHSDMVADLAEAYEEAYYERFAKVEECVHQFPSGRGFNGISDKARCQKCGIHVMSGSTLI
jgi:hypothetical protein